MAKVSDQPGMDEDEPEVFLNARMHAREHITTEQALALLDWLTDGYATSSRIRAIVDTTEVFVVPDLNPDGARFDLQGAAVQGVAQEPPAVSRRPGDRPQPQLRLSLGMLLAARTRGRRPTSTVDRAGSRRPRLASCATSSSGASSWPRISLHSYGGQVLWPYGYTTTDRPDGHAGVAPPDRDAAGEGHRVAQRLPPDAGELAVHRPAARSWTGRSASIGCRP